MPALLVLVRYTYYRTLDTAGSRRSDVPVVPYQSQYQLYYGRDSSDSSDFIKRGNSSRGVYFMQVTIFNSF